MSAPVLRHIANLWTLVGHPAPEREWSLAEKLRAIKNAGFDGVCWAPSPELTLGARELGLIFVGGMSSGQAGDFPGLLQDLKEAGARHVNVQLADDDTPTAEAVGLAILLLEAGRRLGLEPAIEIHRDTCTETPEKAYALADAYRNVTGELLPLTWDFSHLAVVKHLRPADFAARLLVRRELIQRAQQFHLRPCNGHHCQIPVTDGAGNLTAEFRDWRPFAQAALACWLEGNRDTDRELLVCPEMGPVAGGYNLSTLPASWEEAGILRKEIDDIWRDLIRNP